MEDIIFKLTCSTVSMISLIWFCSFGFSKFGMTKSISIMFEKLEDRHKKYFIYFAWGISLPLLGYCFAPAKPAMIIGAFLVALVGALPYSSDKKVKPYHIGLALGGTAIFITGMWIFMGLWLPTVVLLTVGGVLLYIKAWWTVTVLEILAVIFINISLVNSIF